MLKLDSAKYANEAKKIEIDKINEQLAEGVLVSDEIELRKQKSERAKGCKGQY